MNELLYVFEISLFLAAAFRKIQGKQVWQERQKNGAKR